MSTFNPFTCWLPAKKSRLTFMMADLQDAEIDQLRVLSKLEYYRHQAPMLEERIARLRQAIHEETQE